MSNITISRPTVNDVEDIQKLLYETWLATYPNSEAGITIDDIEERFKKRLSPKSIEKKKTQISELPENQLYLIAKDGDVVVGVCLAEIMEKYNELKAINILPSYQRQGIGLMFWERTKAFFGNEKDIIVQVVVYNTPAINFYQKLGFADTGKRFTKESFMMPISGSSLPLMEMVLKSFR